MIVRLRYPLRRKITGKKARFKLRRFFGFVSVIVTNRRFYRINRAREKSSSAINDIVDSRALLFCLPKDSFVTFDLKGL